MIDNNFWIGFIAGLVPCRYESKTDANGEKIRIIAAFFWSYVASSRSDGYRHRVLHIRLPLIGQLWNKCKGLSSFAGAVITQLQEQKPPQR